MTAQSAMHDLSPLSIGPGAEAVSERQAVSKGIFPSQSEGQTMKTNEAAIMANNAAEAAKTEAARASFTPEAMAAEIASLYAAGEAADAVTFSAIVANLFRFRFPADEALARSAKEAAEAARLALGWKSEDVQKDKRKGWLTNANKLVGRTKDNAARFRNAADFPDARRIAEGLVMRAAGANRIEDVKLPALFRSFQTDRPEKDEAQKEEAAIKRAISALAALSPAALLEVEPYFVGLITGENKETPAPATTAESLAAEKRIKDKEAAEKDARDKAEAAAAAAARLEVAALNAETVKARYASMNG